MKTICYIVPYFGKLPKNFPLWLIGCEANPTIDWIIYTDDKTDYKYPANVKCKYLSFQELENRIQSFYDFQVDLSRPWRLSLMKSAYGDLFYEDIKDYDFWGYCDVDLMWGNIRKFYTEEVLNNFDRIGFQGHSTLMRNNEENNKTYKTNVKGCMSYKDVFSGKSDFSFDENGMDQIYKSLNKPYYKRIDFANLLKYNSGFFLGAMPESDALNNKYQIFTWNKGTLLRNYIDSTGGITSQEFCYIHFWCRPMKYDVKNPSVKTIMYMYPDVMTDRPIGISIKSLKRYGHRNRICFIFNSLWVNRHKLTIKRILFNLKNMNKKAYE